MESIWCKTQKLPSFGSFSSNKSKKANQKYDVLIVGGGLAGILCAYKMQQAGVDYLLVEADEICGGMTMNTTAKISSQHRLIYGDIMDRYGLEMARMYYDANEQALKEYRRLCATIDCDFEEKDSYVYSVDQPKKLLRELEAMERMGHPAIFLQNPKVPIDTVGAVKFTRQAQFHPLKFVERLVQNLNIAEHTKVTEFGVHTAVTNRGTIFADNIIITTHFPAINKHGMYFLKMYQNRSYVIALQATDEGEREALQLDGMYVDEDDKGLSFRNYKDMLLLGGGAHRTGKSGGKWKELEEFALTHYPKAQVACRWAAQDCITLDGIPYIGPYAKNVEGLYVATGFNKWGMTSSMVAAEILTNKILKKHTPYEDVFDPCRFMMHPQLALNALEATCNLLTPTTKRCPHMGCALKWNPEERSWDCSCHGSRFTETGKLINNPACDDKEL